MRPAAMSIITCARIIPEVPGDGPYRGLTLRQGAFFASRNGRAYQLVAGRWKVARTRWVRPQ